MSEKQAIGVLGAGRMGLPMAKNMLAEGFEVTVFDLDTEARDAAADAGVDLAATPRELGEDASIVFLVLPTDAAARNACLDDEGVFAGMEDGHVVVCNSSHPSLPGELRDAAPDGVSVVDAPMCRGAIAAREARILFLVGGSDADIEACRPPLEACGEVEVLGDLGAGQVGKTANNLLMWTSIVADYEVFRLVDALDIDIDPVTLREVLPKSSGDNYVLRKGNWEALRLTWPEKDHSIALDIADEADSTIPMSALTSQLIREIDVSDLETFYFPEYLER